MIASHDSFTYLTASTKFFNAVSFLWRTQNKTLIEQYNSGVRYFDIRVKRLNNKYVVCHGEVNFSKEYDTLLDIFQDIESIGKGDSTIRLILESGDNTDEELFTKELLDLIQNLERITDILDFCCIKRTWKVLYNMSRNIIDYSFVPYHNGWSIIKNIQYAFKHPSFVFNTIKNWRKKHAPEITQEMIADNNILYFYDFV